MFQLQLTYTESGKKYSIPFEELVKKVLTQEQVDRIKKEALKEIQKL